MKKAKLYFLLLLLLGYYIGQAQQNSPLSAWKGIWKGNLLIQTPQGKTQNVDMELHIQPSDSAHRLNWKILYNKEPRNYELVTIDASKGKYIIDEKNGIILDAYLIGSVLISRFEVGGSLLICTYELVEKQIIFTIIAGSSEKFNTTGNIPEDEIPEVKSYPVNVFQKAVLKKEKKN